MLLTILGLMIFGVGVVSAIECSEADYDGDGDVDWDDMNTGGCYADLNRDGIWDTADFILMKSNFGETTATLCRRLPLSGIGDCI